MLRRPTDGVSLDLARCIVASLALTAIACTEREPAPVANLRAEKTTAGRALYAVEYARSRGVPSRKLIAVADGVRDMSWYFYVLVGDGAVALIDTGSDVLARSDGEERADWHVEHAASLETALRGVGLEPRDVTNVLLTHAHWDHADGLPKLEHARFHAHSGEWAQLTGSKRARGRAAERVAAAGRASLFEQTPFQVLPGIEARELGKHTKHHTAYVVTCRGGKRIAVSGDGAYLYENLEQALPIAVTTSEADNLRDMAALQTELGPGAVLPGHDPKLFERFTRLTPPSAPLQVARICP
jgi:glyoxylase-like metal-dependent hydrolase (beta-lactamase superfamily II)